MKSRKEMQTRKIYLNPPGSLKKSRIGKLSLVNSDWFQKFSRSFRNSKIRHILLYIFEVYFRNLTRGCISRQLYGLPLDGHHRLRISP